MNDNRPEFEQPSYNTSISETADSGTTVIQVTAVDEDAVSFLATKYNVLTFYNAFSSVLLHAAGPKCCLLV